MHLSVERSGANYIARVRDGEPVNRHKPSVEVLFQSAARIAGRNAIGIMLTGMGRDGLRGAEELRRRGAQILADKTRRDSVPLLELSEILKARAPHRAPGTAIFLTSDPDMAPVALMHNLKHNKVLHEKNIVLTVITAETPRVREEDRVKIEPINDDFKKLTISYGFMESPNLPKALGLCRKLGLKFDIMATSFFLGRRSVVPSAQSGMPLWQDKLFIFLMKNAANPTDFFKIPPGRVVEMGAQLTV